VFAGVGEQCLDVVARGVSLGLAVLGHDVEDVNPEGVRAGDGLGHALGYQVGHDGCIEAAGAENYHVRLFDGLYGLGKGARPLRYEPDPAYALVRALLELGYVGLAHGLGAVVELRGEVDVLVGHGQDAAGDGQDVGHAAHRLVKGVRHAVERGEKEVAEALALEAALRKAVGEELFHDGLRVGQGLDAVAHVAGGRHAQVLAEHAAAAAVVGHGDDGRDAARELLQAAQHG